MPKDFERREALRRQSRYLITIGRMKRGVSIEQPQADMTALVNSMAQENRDDAGIGVRLVAMRDYYPEIALILAAAGLYGVLSNTVTRRTSEIGLRIRRLCGVYDA